MGLSRRVALLSLSALAALEASASDDGDCAEALLSSDADGSGGLDADEFYAFLESVDLPPDAEGYFGQFDTYGDLPWFLRVLHKSLACRCTSLGLGDDCCMGKGAEIPLVGMKDGPDDSAGFEWHRDEVCEQISFVIDEVVGTPSPIAAPVNDTAVESTTAATSGSTTGVTTSSTDEGTPSPIAAPVNETTVESTTAATSSSTEATTSPTEEPAMDSVKIVFLGSVLNYTQTGDLPLFGEETDGDPLPFYRAEDIMANTDDNDVLMQVLNCVGDLATKSLGDFVSMPSKRRLQGAGEEDVMTPIVVEDVACAGGLVYAPEGGHCVAFHLKIAPDEILTEDIIGAFAADLEESINGGDLYRCARRRYPDTSICGLGSPGDGVEYRSKLSLTGGDAAATEEDEDSDEAGVSAGGVVGIVLMLALPLVVWAIYTRHSSSRDRNESGPAEICLSDDHLYLADIPQDPEPAVVNELASAAEGGEAGERGAGELEGKDDDGSRSVASVSDSFIGDVNESFTHIGDVNESFDTCAFDADEGIVEDGAAPPRTAASSLAAMGVASAIVANANSYREASGGGHAPEDSDDFMSCNSRSQTTQSQGEIRKLVEETAVLRSADELLAAYSGREDELLAYLRKMKAERRVEDLVDELRPARSAGELLAAYPGREDELISHLERMRSDPSVERARPGEPSREIAEKHDVEGSGAKTSSTSILTDNTYRKEVDSLVRELKISKSTDDLMNVYAGREEELLAHLRKLKLSTS